MSAVAVVLINGLGDQLLSLPALRALDHIFPGRLRLVLGTGNRFMFYRGIPLLSQHCVPWSDYERKQIDPQPTAASLGRCELFVSLNDWLTESVWELAQAVAPGRTVGVRAMFDTCVRVPDDAHMLDRWFAVAQSLQPSLTLSPFLEAPQFSPAAEEAARALRDELAPPGHKLLFVHPETLAHKRWSDAGFDHVLERFLHTHPEYRAAVCATREPQIRGGAQSARVRWIAPHLELAMALVGKADLFLGIDSCFLHAADLFRLPGVALFGPTDPRHWGFRVSPHGRDVWAPEMRALTPEAVLEALEAVSAASSGGAS